MKISFIAVLVAAGLILPSQKIWAVVKIAPKATAPVKATPTPAMPATPTASASPAASVPPASATPAPNTAPPVPAKAPVTDKNSTFVEQCLTQTTILDKVFECKIELEDNVSVLSFALNKARHIQVRATGQFGSFSKDFGVQRITHLHPRVTPNGVVDESIRFYSENILGTNRATVTVPCHQEDVAYVGLTKLGDSGLPEELVAACQTK